MAHIGFPLIASLPFPSPLFICWKTIYWGCFLPGTCSSEKTSFLISSYTVQSYLLFKTQLKYFMKPFVIHLDSPILLFFWELIQFSRSVVSDSLRPHELQHAKPPCPSPSPGVHPNSSPSSQWCHPAISSPSPPAPNPSQHQTLLQWVNTLHEVSKVQELQL